MTKYRKTEFVALTIKTDSKCNVIFSFRKLSLNSTRYLKTNIVACNRFLALFCKTQLFGILRRVIAFLYGNVPLKVTLET